MKPFFSIIVPCCDVERYVRECLDSVLSQPFADWECLLGVETSKDKTEEIVRDYAAKDSRFRMFAGPRSGSPATPRNLCLGHAQGEYVIFLDGDDFIAEGALQRLHDKIAARPGADLYPCAIAVRNELSGRDEPTRDNYPADFGGELDGPGATLLSMRDGKTPCPMAQIAIYRRAFLLATGLRFVPGLRWEDSEFSPRARYLARRVMPLHEPHYIYRIRGQSVTTAVQAAGDALDDWAAILRSLFAFHAQVATAPGFDRRVGAGWARQWIRLLLYFWFDPARMAAIPRAVRAGSLHALFAQGFGDFSKLLSAAALSQRLAGLWVGLFARHPLLRPMAEVAFRLYFLAARAKS